MKTNLHFNRRDFLKLAAAGAGAMALGPFHPGHAQLLDFRPDQKLARVCASGEGAWFDLKARPYWEAQNVGTIYRDDVVEWVREVVTSHIDYNRINQRWVETPRGYIYSPYVQPVYNRPNQALLEFPRETNEAGMWVEQTVPVVDIKLEQAPSSPWLQNLLKPRIYYSQVFWVDQIKKDDNGQTWYRLREKYWDPSGNYVIYGDILWGMAEAFRPVLPDELTPIHPDAADKKIVVSLLYQTLSCMEGNQEVYFCRVSTGYKDSTPVGDFPSWQKNISTHMSGGVTGAGFDTAGIGWTVLFSSDGAAVHSTFWHNDFGLARTHGCVNCTPEDAKWVFRWTLPSVGYSPGGLITQGMNASTHVVIMGA
jgi:hypothetical protein